LIAIFINKNVFLPDEIEEDENPEWNEDVDPPNLGAQK
jgi:hypothetical protein